MTWPYGNAYERLDENGAVMYVRTAERTRLAEARLLRYEDVMGAGGGEVVSRHGLTRETLRLTLATPADLSAALARAGGRTVYLKRARASHWKDALKDLARLRRVRTRARHEFDMLRRFRRAGVSVPDALAMGERHVFGRDVGSYVLVGALASGRSLDVALTEPEDASVRRRLARSLARFAAAMHEKGLTHGELFAKHVFVEESGDGTLERQSPERRGGDDGGWSVSVIDLQQALVERSASRGRRARDLAALLVSLRPEETTMRERLTFLREYLGKKRLGPADLAFARVDVLAAARGFARRDACRSWRETLEETSS